jgi:hypothetical protein
MFEKLTLEIPGLVKRNMQKSDAAGGELAAIMLSKAPDSIKTESETLDKRRVEVFKKATSAFEKSTGGEEHADKEDDSD